MENMMTKNHRCTDCKTIYECCADECCEPYWLQCTPCEIKEWDSTHTPEQTKLIKEIHELKCELLLK